MVLGGFDMQSGRTARSHADIAPLQRVVNGSNLRMSALYAGEPAAAAPLSIRHILDHRHRHAKFLRMIS